MHLQTNRDWRCWPLFVWSVFLTMAALPVLAAEQEIKLPITADDSICCANGEQEFNQGGKSNIKLKGIENLVIFNFDPTPIKGHKITKATLHIKGTDDKLMVRHVGFSTIASPWKEGTQSDTIALAGEICLRTPKFGSKELWAGPDSSFLDCFGGRGGTIWAQTFVTHDNEMWYTMQIDPRIVEACAAGLSYGICMTDDNGQTGRGSKAVVKDGNQSNNKFFSREQKDAAPYLLVESAALPPAAPPVVAAAPKATPWPHGADFDTGGLELTWTGPQTPGEANAVIGYRISLAVDGGAMAEIPRWQTPAPVPAGETPRALLRWLKAGAEVKARIEVLMAGGQVVAAGETTGQVSPAFPLPVALNLAVLHNAAGDPPVVDGSKIWAIPDGAKANPVTGNVMEEIGLAYEGEAGGKFNQVNCAWSGATRTVTLNALRGEWVAFQIVCQNKDANPATYAIKPGNLTGPDGAVIPAAAVELAWLWYHHIGEAEKAWYADPLVPLKAGESFTVPNKLNAIPGQQNQTVYAELFVPKDAKPGAYKGTMEVTAGKEIATLNVALQVRAALIPNETHFTVSMNDYFSPGRDFGEPGTAEFMQAEQAFYLMCHLHRTDLAVVHYSHSSKHDPGSAPPITGTGKEARVKDWSEFDQRFGALLDGSLFKGTPREGTAISHFMVNLAENYPAPMTSYKWNDVKWEEHWKVYGPIAEGFPQEYQDTWVAVAKDYIKHAKEKKYRSQLQVLLNNKYFYKQYDDKKKNWGKGTSFWLLDEPQHIDDFSALAFYGDLLRKAQEGDRQTLVYRVDVSRPEWARTTLGAMVDLNVSGGGGNYRHLLEDWRERFGQQIWHYAGTLSSQHSALGIEAQALDLYGRGVDGYVPAESMGGPDSWTELDPFCVLYNGKHVGVNGPCSSLRLKAYRRGQQDVEYMYLLALQRDLLKNDPNRRQVGNLVIGALSMTKKFGTLDQWGAVTESISGLNPENFERLRIAIAKELK